MIALAGAVCLVAALGQDANLLSNSSFEEIAPDERPVHWSFYVKPQDGAFAEVDPLAADGTHAAMLHIPNPYAVEPANNWSQVVVADFAGKDLTLTGKIRTEAAGEAALWIQCFTKSPARVAAAATTATQHRIDGTTDWTPVEVHLTAPTPTDFVVVRCVLKGRGTAWFDDIRLEATDQNNPDLPAIEPALEKLPAAPPKDLGDLDLLELSKALNKEIADLEANNSKILERVQRLQQELDKTRAATTPGELAPLEYRHPLVPHGWKPEGAPK